MNVVGAYLNGDLDHEIYMTQPPGFSDGTAKVLQLLKAIYGLKQSGRAWRQKLTSKLASLGYTPLLLQQSVFIRKTDTSVDMLAIHVNNIAIAAHSSRIAQIKEGLNSIFDMNDLGELTSMIGFHITRNRNTQTITLSQSSCALKIVERLGLSNANPLPTPLNTHVKLTPTPKGKEDPKMADAPALAAT